MVVSFAPRVVTVMGVALVSGCSLSKLPDVEAMIARVSATSLEANLRELVAIGPRYSGSVTESAVAVSHVRTKLESFGYTVIEEPFDSWVAGAPPLLNLIVEIEGREPHEIIEIGAHYDTVRNVVGADDNGSGAVGLLEVARVLSELPPDQQPRKTIRLLFFGAEEAGLVGSSAHVARLDERGEATDGILVLEMIGYASSEEGSQDAPLRVPLIASLPTVGDFILVVGNMSSGGIGNWFECAVDTYVPELRYYSANRIGGFFADAARSDHSPYWKAGRRGVMLSDTANFRNPHYHRASDTIEHIDFEFMTRVTRAVVATALHWSQ